jgi:prophage DNA circulation protein
MSFSDVEHYATMFSGCEAIGKRDYKHPDAVYASAVLQVHANDLGQYAGQEGFLDSVKKGAGNTKEFLAKMYAAIKEWFVKVFKVIRAGFRKTFTRQLSPSEASSISNKLKAMVAAVKDYSSEIGGEKLVTACEKAIDALDNQHSAQKSVDALNDVLQKTDDVVTSFLKYADSKKPADTDEEKYNEYVKILTSVRKFSSAVNGLVMSLRMASSVRVKEDKK